MGNKKFNLTKLALAMGVTLGLSGCFSDNDNNIDIKPPVQEPVDTVDVVQPPTPVEAQSAGFVVNVADALGAPIEAAEGEDPITAKITFTSATAGLLSASAETLVDADADTEALDLETIAGAFSFTVTDIPEGGVTYEFVIEAPGFLSNTSSVTLNADESLTEVVKLTQREFASEDIAVVAKTSSLGDLAEEAAEGATATYTADAGLQLDGVAELTLPATVDGQEDKAVGGAEVTLKNGIQFLQEDGEPLSEAPTLTVAYYANEATATESSTDEAAKNQTSSIDAFPGGLNLSVSDGDGGETSGNFTTGGFVAIELVNSQGESVKSFGEGNTLSVAMQVDKNTQTPCPVMIGKDKDGTDIAGETLAQAAARGFEETGVCKADYSVTDTVQIQPGHVFPVWSYEESNGQWSFEQFGEVAASEDADAKTHNVVVDVNHLSYWNLDFFAQRGCNVSSFNIVDSDNNPSSRFTSIQLLANSYRFEAQPWNRAALNSATFYNPPSFDVEVRVLENNVNVLDGVQGQTVDQTASVYSGSLCDLNGETLVLTPVDDVEVVTKPVSTFAVCSNNDAGDVAAEPVLSPTTVQLYRGAVLANNLQDSYYGSEFNINLDSGVDYTFRFFNTFTNTWETQTATGSTDALSLNMLTECEIEEEEVTGTGGS